MTPIALQGIPNNIRKFLMLITFTEGTDRDGTPYNELFGFKNFVGYQDHPRIIVKTKNYSSSAAGRYQILRKTFDYLKKKRPSLTFSPQDQDTMAIMLIKEQGAYELILAGKFEQAILKTNDCWASLPSSPYGQPTHTMTDAIKFLNSIK